MREITITGIQSVYNKPPFVNEILDEIRPDGISHWLFDKLVKESRMYELSTILTAMVRNVDLSGVIPNLAGAYTDPQDVLELLTNLGHRQLLKIDRLDQIFQDEIFAALKGNRCTLRALLKLDESQREVIEQLTQIRQSSPLAQAIRQSTEGALRDLFHHPEKMVSELFDQVLSLHEKSVLYHHEPRICYSTRIKNGNVVEVWQFFFVPRIETLRLPAPFKPLTVVEALEKITPHMYTRKYGDDGTFDPRTPSGYIGLLGKVGGALPRLIAAQVEQNELLRKKLTSEYDLSEAMHGLFSR